MGNLINFPDTREPLIAVLRSAVAPERYALVIVDPEENGPILPVNDLDRRGVRDAIVELYDMAGKRGLKFEVRDFSKEGVFTIGDNDNG